MHRRLIAQLLIIIGIASLVLIAPPAPALAAWSLTGPLSTPRAYHTASVLPDGRVLLVGGASNQGTLSSTDIFDPATNSWSPGASLSAPRISHRAVTLADGRIMVVGGSDNGNSAGYNNAKVYDPASNSWSDAGTLSVGRRAGHTATLLSDGRVLVTGGYWFDGVFGNDRASAEIYSPATNSWSTVAPMTGARSNHTATLLPDGRVLIAGQPTCGDCGYPSAELYDPVANTWSPAGDMVTPRIQHTATLLNDNRVLVVGGAGVTTAEIYNPVTNSWSFAGNVGRREDHTATLLADGRVLVAGSLGPGTGLPSDPSTLIFDPATNTWSDSDRMSTGRGGHTATLLADGRVLVAGGRSEHTVTTVNTAEKLQLGVTAPLTVTPSATTADGQPYTAGTWTLQAVTVHFTCASSGSGIASCPADQVFSDEGIFTTSGTAIDNDGNTVNVSFGPIQIGTGLPTITAFARGGRNRPYDEGTWTNQAVTVHFECEEAGSTLETCPDNQVFSDEGIYTATGSVTDNAGNHAEVTFGPIQIDKTLPTITASATTADGQPYIAGTWTEQAVTVHYLCDDARSGIAFCPEDELVTDSATPTGRAIDNAGNRASVTFGPIQISHQPTNNVLHDAQGGIDCYGNPGDGSYGSVVLSRSGNQLTVTVNVVGGQANKTFSIELWESNPNCFPDNNGDTGFRLTTDADGNGQSIFTLTLPYPSIGGVVLGDGQGDEAIAVALDSSLSTAAGDTYAAGTIALPPDTAPLTITASATTADGEVYTSGTWISQTVTVHFTCSAAAVSCPAEQEYSADGIFTASGTARDSAGNTADASFGPIRVDKTPPTFAAFPVAITVPATLPDGAIVSYGQQVLPDDNLDPNPVATCTPGSPPPFPLGTTSVSCTVTDAAGNRNEGHFPVTVNPASSATTLTSSGAAVYGQPVTFTATLTSAAGLPTGTVTFKDAATTLGTGTLSHGVATFTTAALAVGSHSISAVYAGESVFAGSASSSLNQTIAKAATTSSFTTSSNPSVAGQAVTFTATVAPVAPGAGTPTGTVTFKDGTATLGTSALSGGIATFTTAPLTSGNHAISVSYAGDGNFTASTSASGVQVVKAASSITVASSASPSVYGQAVTFTANVSAATTPAGTVTFLDGTRTIGTKSLAQGSASLALTNLSAGSHTITAVYNGNASTSGNVSPPLSQVVNAADTSAVLTSLPTASVLGQTVTLTATISILPPGAGTLTGTITFLDGTTVLGTKTISHGQAALALTTLSVGSHTLTATYNGTPNFNVSTTPALTLVVNPADTSTALVATPSPSVAGQKVTFTATVQAVAPGAGTPSGTVTFYDGTTILGSQSLVNGKAVLATIALTVGNHSITAAYSGSANFGSSTAAALSQVVNQASSTTTLTATPNPTTLGKKVTFTVTVKAVAPGVGTPSGSVTFMDGTTVLSTMSLVSGKATLATSALALGSHTITAVYSGDPSFTASTSVGLVLTIN